MSSSGPLYLGLDLSTQQLKCLAVSSDLKVVASGIFDFDSESTGYGIHKGVIINEEEDEVYAPVALWLEALDAVLRKLSENGVELGRVCGISCAGQQHGSVYWSKESDSILGALDPARSLKEQLTGAFSHPYSPNWQDASTSHECADFDNCLGSPEELARRTGSSAHHRFTGPQIMRFKRKYLEAYVKTSRISLVSSFLASVLLGYIAPLDISDVCGMNLWNIEDGSWDQDLLELVAGGGKDDALALQDKLGQVAPDAGHDLGCISNYFTEKYGFHKECRVFPSTGDNPATILALPLRENDAIVSLGTSTTFLMNTSKYAPEAPVHFFNHPTTPGTYMYMLCYKNGGLARERVRDRLNKISKNSADSWDAFDRVALSTEPLGQSDEHGDMKLGLYFPQPEIVPKVRAGEWRFHYNHDAHRLVPVLEDDQSWRDPEDDVRAIVEGQLLSLRYRSRHVVQQEGNLPAQPRRIYLVGGASKNAAIAKIAGEVLGGTQGIWQLDVGENACALGAAYKAVWACEREDQQGGAGHEARQDGRWHGETFEDFLAKRWDETSFVKKIGDGYQRGVWQRYGIALDGFEQAEDWVLKHHASSS